MDLQNQPDGLELIRRAGGGDRDAWDTLVREHGPHLTRLAGIRLDPRLAGRLDPEDLVQDALADAFETLDAFFPDSESVTFSYWLRQRLLDRVRRAHRDHLGTLKRDAARECPQSLDPEGSHPMGIAWVVDSGTSPSH